MAKEKRMCHKNYVNNTQQEFNLIFTKKKRLLFVSSLYKHRSFLKNFYFFKVLIDFKEYDPCKAIIGVILDFFSVRCNFIDRKRNAD